VQIHSSLRKFRQLADAPGDGQAFDRVLA